MSLKDWSQSSNSSESLLRLSSSANCSAPTAPAVSRPLSKRKPTDANDSRVNDPKQVRLRAHPVSMFEAEKKYFNATWYLRCDCLKYFVKLVAVFVFLATILNLKLEETFEKCVVNQLLQPMALVIGSMLLK